MTAKIDANNFNEPKNTIFFFNLICDKVMRTIFSLNLV